MNFESARDVRVVLPRKVLNAVFDECDRFDEDETGGRLIGTFDETGRLLTLNVRGVIEPGPRARRSRVSFFQDGEHQERVFRQIEDQHAAIEHLGNWHTHHCNGLPHLSDGDLTTYKRIVNHHNHNTSFFYALLVVARGSSGRASERYLVKHYLFRRNDDSAYAIPERCVEMVDEPILWPIEDRFNSKTMESRQETEEFGARPERATDRELLKELYPGMRPFTSPKLGFYWRGPLELVDGSKLEVVVVESRSRALSYSVMLRGGSTSLKDASDSLTRRQFATASAALIATERACNVSLFRRGEEERRKS